MASSIAARLASTTALAVGLAAVTLAAPATAQTGQVTICEATGSPSNPYVFTTIDASALSEHLARGDYQANSLADCTVSKPAPTPVPQAPQAATPAPAATAAPPSSAVQQQTLSGTVPISNAQVSQTAPTPTAAASAGGSTAEVARTSPTTAVEVSGAESGPQPDVSALPRSGGEPDRVPIVVGLLAVCAAGLALRRLARVQR